MEAENKNIPTKIFKKYEFKTGCFGKKRYHSEAVANYVLDEFRDKRFLNVYKCKFCDGYHIGNVTKKTKNKRHGKKVTKKEKKRIKCRNLYEE